MIRNLPIIVSTDNSPSAKNKWRYIKPGLYDLLAGLAERNREDVDVHVRGLEQTAKYVAGGNIVKVIVVPGKIVNIVVK